MALDLPDWLTDAFNLIGLPWPGIDEDTLRDWARSIRTFATDVCDTSGQANQAMSGLAESSQSGVISAIAEKYESHHRLLTELRGPIEDFAQALDYAADAVVAQKWIVIGAATALAAEFTATQIGAIFSLGADEAALPEEVISTQQIVKFALKELEAVVIGRLINWGAQELSDHVNSSLVKFADEAWAVKMEQTGLKTAYHQISNVARQMRGHADEAERIGNQAHSENTSRKLEDSSGGGGWAEVINALKQGLLDIAKDLFKSLPGAIAKIIRSLATVLEKFVAKLKGVDEEGDPAVSGGGARAPAPKEGVTPGSKRPPGPRGGNREVGDASNGPGACRSNGECTRKGDPVDVATGDVMMEETDVTLPGILPLILGRVHRSSRQTGRWFGQSWTSSLDQRLTIADGRIIGTFDDGRLLAWTDPANAGILPVTPESGPLWTLQPGDDGAYAVHDPQRGLTWRFERRAGYNDELPLTTVTDRIGHEIIFNYDAEGRPLSVVHSGGYRVLVSVADERVTALTLAGRNGEDDIPLRQFEYGTDGNLSGVINSSGLPMRFTYDDAGRLTNWTDRNGYSYRYTFDSEGRCVRGEGPDGILSGTFEYEAGITRWIAIDGAVTTYEITDSAETAAVTDALGNTTRWAHDSRGRILSETDPLGRATAYEYDSLGNLVSVTRPDDEVARAEYDDRCQAVMVEDFGRGVWRQRYDGRGNRLGVTQPDGTVVRYAYDDAGHVAAVTDPFGAVTRVTCDAAGLPVLVADPDEAETRYERDQFGLVRLAVAPDGAETAFSWTVEGRPASRTLPDGAVERWEWDGEGNLLRHVSPAGAVTSHEYGAFEHPVVTMWPDETRTAFSYDCEQRVTSVNHGGLTWDYSYDAAGRLVTETDYDGASTSYAHDSAGQLVRKVNAAGQTVSYAYDLVGNMVFSDADETVATFEYNADGLLTRATGPAADVEFARDALGRVLRETCNGRTVTTAYDPAGRVVSRVTPSGIASAWEYDAAGLPVALSSAGQKVRFEHDAFGQEVRRALPGGVTLTQDWDPSGRLVAQRIKGTAGGQRRPENPSASGQLLQRREYAYNPDGFVTGMSDLLTGSRTFRLGPSGRITEVTGPGWAERYAYDLAGNLADASWPAIPSGSAGGWLDDRAQGPREVSGTQVRRAGNMSYRYDDAGRVVRRTRTRISRKPETWRYTWDAEDRLVSVVTPDGAAWRYSYDPFGRRIGKEHVAASGETIASTWFAWDGDILVEQAQITFPDETASEVVTWDYEPGSFTPVVQVCSSPADAGADALRRAPQSEIDQRFFAIVTDLTGAPSELVASDGTLAGYRQRTLWGGTAWNSSGASVPLRFPGQYADDETGLHYNNERYYDPVTGAYLSPDPLGLAPAPNPHAYVSNPVVDIDPLGLVCEKSKQNLKGGETQDAVNGKNAHNGPEWKRHLAQLGYKKGSRVPGTADIPDGFTHNGHPVELKPDTRSGVKAGTRRLHRYMNNMRTDYGELWLWSKQPDGSIKFRLGAIPKKSIPTGMRPSGRGRWLKF